MKKSKTKSLYGDGTAYNDMPEVHNVKQLRELLQKLPDDLPIYGTTRPIWFNIGNTTKGVNGEHFELTEGWDE